MDLALWRGSCVSTAVQLDMAEGHDFAGAEGSSCGQSDHVLIVWDGESGGHQSATLLLSHSEATDPAAAGLVLAYASRQLSDIRPATPSWRCYRPVEVLMMRHQPLHPILLALVHRTPPRCAARSSVCGTDWLRLDTSDAKQRSPSRNLKPKDIHVTNICCAPRFDLVGTDCCF